MQSNVNYYLYEIIENTKTQIFPAREVLLTSLNFFKNQQNPLYYTDFARITRANLEMAERLTRTYHKLTFDIKECIIDGQKYQMEQKIVLAKPFCDLQHFSKIGLEKEQPKLLIVAPMAGHHATLLKSTVQDLAPYFDIYLTDWIDAKYVPLRHGTFDMDDFIDHVIEFIRLLSPELHVMAVCQPTVPVLAAISILSADNDPDVPKSMILIGGPVDASKNPTKVNNFATDKTIEWFEQTLITLVPRNYPGRMRAVYPGYMQLIGFMNLDVQRHIDNHINMFKDLINQNTEKVERQAHFYDEYLSVMDLPAEFYLQTIREVFQNFSLAKGTLVSRGRKIDTHSIRKCALLGIEGEKDDIAGVGQTEEALNLCSNIPKAKKKHYLQHGVGHYGVFSGRKFREHIVPVIKDFVYKL